MEKKKYKQYKCWGCDKTIAIIEGFCADECFKKWEKTIDPEISKKYNSIIKELEEDVEYLEDHMCERCKCSL